MSPSPSVRAGNERGERKVEGQTKRGEGHGARARRGAKGEGQKELRREKRGYDFLKR